MQQDQDRLQQLPNLERLDQDRYQPVHIGPFSQKDRLQLVATGSIHCKSVIIVLLVQV
jgi:hypothetical protein